jgi:hypothetical protein
MAKTAKLRPWTKEDVRTLKTLRESENECDRAQTEADAGSDASASIQARRVAGGRSREAGLKAAGHTTWWARLIALWRIGTAPRGHLGEIHYGCRIVILK